MSYILDALKKSEKKRQQENGTPKLHAAQPIPPKPVREPNRRLWWIFPVVLITSGFLGYTISSRTTPTDTTTTLPKQKTPVTAEQSETTVETSPVPELQPSGKKVIHRQNVPVSPSPPQPAMAQETEPIATAAEVEPPRQEVPLLEDVDPVVRESIPIFKLAGHVYSPDPQLRMILINNSVVRENDVVEKGFIVEEITTNGVILRKGDVRFRMPID